MSQVEKLDLMGVASLAFITAALLVAWIAVSHDLRGSQRAEATASPAVTLTQDGRMKLTVAAERAGAATPVANARTAAVPSSPNASL